VPDLIFTSDVNKTIKAQRGMIKALASITAVCLLPLFLCSCASPPLPPDVKMDARALQDGQIVVRLRLKSGGDLPFLVDTGSPGTLFDKSLIPQLGWRLPIPSVPVPMGDGTSQKSGVYLEPKLFLGGTRLKTGHLCATHDFKGQSKDDGNRYMGILAMDCLRHYCVQLDFQTREMRFLKRPDTASFGQSYPLRVSHFYDSLHTKDERAGLAGGKSARLLVDTGDNSDGQITKDAAPTGTTNGWAHLPQCTWDGRFYTNLDVSVGINALGLQFLARHLVTFDFPHRTMYLKQTSIGPFLNEEFESAFAYLRSLKDKGEQPGWSKTDHGTLDWNYPADADAVGFALRKEGVPGVYHYLVVRPSADGSWKLQRAWRTDKTGATVEEFPVR
jgi:hypothetical protein